jgi:integrase
MATPNGSIPPVSTQDIPAHLQMPGGLSITAGMQFAQAADLWMQSRTIETKPGMRIARYIRPTTEVSYRQYVATLKLFFGRLRLCDIRLDHIANYQAARVQGAAPFIRKRRPQDKEAGPCPAKAKKANQELTVLKMILRRAKLWGEEQDLYYQPLQEDEPEIPRALSQEEQARWLGVAQSEARWHIVYWYSVLAFATCMSTNEVRSLRLGDVSLEARVLAVPWEGSKNRYRHRTIPVADPEVLWALKWFMDRAARLGSCQPQHYLFPSRKARGIWNPNAPMSESGIKRQWEEVREASKLTWFRQYDTRHTAITRMAEAGVPISIIMDFAGHISEKMTRHYTHISEGMKIKAMQQVQQRARVRGRQFPERNAFMHGTPPSFDRDEFVFVPIEEPTAPPETVDRVQQLLRLMQEQFGLTAEQVRDALTAQTSQSPALAAPSNLIGFRPR